MEIFQGAESFVHIEGNTVIKQRVRKPYRIEELDLRIMKTRTRREAKVLKKLNDLGIPTPRLIESHDNVIVMERIHGMTLKEKINSVDDPRELFHGLGELVSSLHQANIIHGDLTTSNFIFSDRMYVIDFGLSYTSSQDEDKAVDLYVLERAINCAHDIDCLEYFYDGYGLKEKRDVERKLEVVRSRGRKREEAFG